MARSPTLCTSSRAPAATASLAVSSSVAWTMSGRPAVFAAAPAAWTAAARSVAGRSSMAMSHTLTASAPIACRYSTPLAAAAASAR